MALNDYKITEYKKPISALPDVPGTAGYNATELKKYFDGKADEEIKTAINAIIDFLVLLSGNETLKGFKIGTDGNLLVSTDGKTYKDTGYSKTETDAFLERKADSNEVLLKTNAVPYEPAGEYNPATKKYVDSKVLEAGAADMAQAVYDPNGFKQDVFAYAVPRNANAQAGNVAVFTAEGGIADGGVSFEVSEGILRLTYVSNE